MATRKPATPTTAAKKPGTALKPWEEQMAQAASKQSAAEKPVGGFAKISAKGGILAIDGVPLEDNELRCVVLVAMHENTYFPGTYDPNNSLPPSCFSYGEFDSDTAEEDMAPHEESETPQGDEETGKCAGCWANVMGSADTGRGKACKNGRRLALITEDALDSAEAMAAAEIRSFAISVTSVKFWAKYVRETLGEVNRPYYGVITKIKVSPDAKTQFKVNFGFEELIDFDQATWDAMHKRIAEAQKAMVQPYQKPSEVAAARPQPAARPVRGPVSRKAPPAAAAPAKPAAKARSKY
jgi:hypothetical protein